MKIYTLTCHDVYNHGASLQAYALMKFLINCGHEVEIIDYKPRYLSNHYRLLNIDNPRWEKNLIYKILYLLLKLPIRIIGLQRKRAFDRFNSKLLKLTNKRYKTNEELKNLPVTDAYICGSDQIWNCLYENGKDPAFYLDFAPKEKLLLSYAASFATDIIPKDRIPFVKNKVRRLDGVSVREMSGVEILKRMNISHAVNVVDPALLLDRNDWDKIGQKKFNEDYILIYDFENSNIIKKISTEIAMIKGYKIHSINPGKINYADKQHKYVGPEVFISLVRDAKFVISNSFHAAVFSVIFQKEFVIINRSEAINTRMRDFLCDIKLSERLVDENYNVKEILKPIKYNRSEEILNTNISFSKKYLNDILQLKKQEKDAL